MQKLYLIDDYKHGQVIYAVTTSKKKANKIVNEPNNLIDAHRVDDAELSKSTFGIDEAPLVNNLKDTEHAINNVLITPNGKHRLTDVGKSIFE